jgi:hypothetical protein
MKRGGGEEGKEGSCSFTCVALIGFIRFINTGGCESIASRSMGNGTYSRMSEGPEKHSIFRHTAPRSCVVPGCQSQFNRRQAACGSRCPFQRVSHEFGCACDDELEDLLCTVQ